MRFSPQGRAIFQHVNFKKCSQNDMFCTFSLPNVLFATAACNFSTSELKKVLRTRHVFHIFTSECAFRHSGVQFLISPLTTCLRTRRFNRPTFGRTRHTNHRENTAFRDFSNIWRGCIFFLLTFALLHLLPSDLTACLICFSTLHIVGSLLFKLPAIIHINSYSIGCSPSSSGFTTSCQGESLHVSICSMDEGCREIEWLAKPPPTKRAPCNTFVFGIHLGFETKQCFQAYLWSIDACAVWPLQHKDYICNNNHLIHTKSQHPTVCPQIFLQATGWLLWISCRGDMVRELRLDYGGHSFRWFDTDEMIRVHGSGMGIF